MHSVAYDESVWPDRSRARAALAPDGDCRELGDSVNSIAANRHEYSPWKLERALRDELQWIVMKCLEEIGLGTRPTAQPAPDLARDIDRYVMANDQPVEA